jgi:hypothetical protein
MRKLTLPVRLRRMAGCALIATVAFPASACKDLLKVEDPQTFGNEDLDDPNILAAVADGVEGIFQQTFDDALVYAGLMSDELEDTSTWVAWADMSAGVFRPNYAGGTTDFAGPQNDFLRARYAATNAAERFERVMGKDAAAKTRIMAQVKATEAWSDLINAMDYCEAPIVAGGPRQPDNEVLKAALPKFTDAITIATAAGSSAADFLNWARAGRARTNLFLGSYDAALADAQAVPAGYRKQALYAEGVSTSFPGNQLHTNRNRSGSLRSIWWSMVDTSNNAVATNIQFVKDPWTLQNDNRMQVLHPRGRLGVNNRTRHYSIQKYADRAAPITITSKREMNLVEAEAYWRKGQLPQAIEALNRNRTTAPASLPAFDAAGLSADDVFQRILSERFAELFVEGHRLNDLARFNLVTARLGTGRSIKFPLSRTEILNNANMKEGEATCPKIS